MNIMESSYGLRAVRAGSATGAGLAGWQADTGRIVEMVRKVPVTYWCPQGHETTPVFAELAEMEIPKTWDCPRCGRTACRERGANAERPGDEPFKSHLEYAKERRTPEEAERVLQDALDRLRRRRS
jgi:RNA polymerase-binding protein